MAKANYITFSGLPEGTERNDVYRIFSPFGRVKKLYIRPIDNTGKAYFENRTIVEEVFNALNDAPPFYLKLSAFTDIGDPYLNDNMENDVRISESSYSTHQTDDEDDVFAEFGPCLVNVNGIQVSTLSSDDGEIFVPLSEVKEVGFELFNPDEVPDGLDYDLQTVKEFQLYMAMKAKKFMMRRKYKVPERIVEKTKQKLESQVFGDRSAIRKDFSNLKRDFTQNDNARRSNDRSSNQIHDDRFQSALRKPYGGKDDLRYSNSNNEKVAAKNVERRQQGQSNVNIGNNNFQKRDGNLQNRDDEFQKRDGNCQTRDSNFRNRDGNFKNRDTSYQNRDSRGQQSLANNGKSANYKNAAAVVNISSSAVKTNVEPLNNQPKDIPSLLSLSLENTSPVTSQHKVNVEEAAAVNVNTQVYEQISLTLDSAVEVEIVHVESKQKCWVTPKNNKVVVGDLLLQTNLEAEQVSAGQPSAGKICAAKFGEEWYRSFILHAKPTIKVIFIDFGNKNTEEICEIRDLPTSVTSVPAQAVCVQFETIPSSPLIIEAELKIIPKKKCDGETYIVVEEEDVKEPSEILKKFNIKPARVMLKREADLASTCSITPKHGNSQQVTDELSRDHNVVQENSSTTIKQRLVKTPTEAIPETRDTERSSPANGTIKKGTASKEGLCKKKIPKTSEKSQESHRKARPLAIDSVGSSGQLECTEIVNDTTFVATIIPEANIDELTALEEIKNEARLDKNFVAKIGDTVAVIHDDDWVRGVVINIKDHKYVTALIDYGIIISSTDICGLERKFVDIPEFSCVCTCSSENMGLLKKFKESQCVILEPNKLELKLRNGVSCRVRCERWDPFLTSKLPTMPKQSEPIFTIPPAVRSLKNDDIVIIISFNSKLFVRTKECNTLYKTIVEEIKQFKPEPLQSKPVENQIVLCPYESRADLYRGVVKSINNTLVEIDFIDYGFVDFIPVANLKTISENLATRDCTLIPIKLKNFEEEKLSSAVVEALTACCNQKEKFYAKCTADSNVFDLLDTKRCSFSEKLFALEASTSKSPGPRPSSSSSIMTYQKMIDQNLPRGSNKLTCINVENLHKGYITFLPNDENVFDILLKISDELKEGTKTDNTPYHPVVDEICVALFEGEWYRAKVEKADKVDSFDVHYIDFGNLSTVSSEEIRRIPRELTELAPCAVNCRLQDLENKEISGRLLERLKEEVVINETYDVNVISKDKNKLYNISIPQVMKTLKQEKLL